MKRKWIASGITILLCLAAAITGFMYFSTKDTPVSQAQEDTFSIKLNKETVKKDKNFVLNVAISSQQEMQTVQAQIAYDPDMVEFQPKDAAIVGTQGILTLNDTFETPVKEINYKISFKALQVGTCDFQLTNANYSLYSDLSIVTKGDVTTTVTVIENTGENDDSTLEELLVGQGDFVEPWDSDTYDYTIIVPENTKELTYSATPSSKDSIVESNGPEVLSAQDHVYTITVTAPSGSQSVYTITVLFEKTGNTVTQQTDDIADTESTTTQNKIETEPDTQADLDQDLIDMK